LLHPDTAHPHIIRQFVLIVEFLLP
jgi:hypothetical protein